MSQPLVTDWIVAIATIVNVGIAFFIWLATKRYVAATIDILHAQTAPFLSVVHVHMTIRGNQDRVAQLKLKNSGSGPALNVRTATSVFLGTRLLAHEAPESVSPIAIGPGEVIEHLARVSATEFESINRGELHLTVVLASTFESLDGRRLHRTERLRFDPEVNSFTLL